MAVFNGNSLPFVCYNGRKMLERFVVYEKPTLVAPYISVDSDVLTITDKGNSNVNSTVRYDLYVNDDLLTTTLRKTINLLDYIKVAGTFNLKVQAKATDYNPSDFSNVVEWTYTIVEYVSLGDSIAAGHTINEDWETDYGVQSQYGENGNTKTQIVTNSYTDLIRNKLVAEYGEKHTSVTSFAHSGDTVADLITKLDQTEVKNAIKKADIVTICIGANDVLQPAISKIGDYINYGNPTLNALSVEVQGNLDILGDDSNSNSYTALFNKLKALNSNAKYVFTTVFNPLKYLWLDESTWENDYKDGFFGPLMWAIPETIGSLSNTIRKTLYETGAVQTVFDRINGEKRDGTDGLAAWTETYVTKLNQVLKNKISAYGNSNFVVADTKVLYDTFPDRPIDDENNINYNDLVNVEFTRGYVIENMDWGQFWNNISYTDLLNSPNAIVTNIITNIVTNVIVPDIDPHPELDGHYALYRSFADILGWESLTRYTISYATATGGTGSMPSKTLVTFDGLTAYTNIGTLGFSPDTSKGYYFTGWKDGSGTSYSANALIGIKSNITLTAQWSNLYTLTYRVTEDSGLVGSDESGHVDYYGLYIGGTLQSKFSKFSDAPRKISVAYGTTIKVVAKTHSGKGRSYVSYNGSTKAGTSSNAEWSFTFTGNTDINFEFNKWQSTDLSDYGYDLGQVAYWNCYITQ